MKQYPMFARLAHTPRRASLLTLVWLLLGPAMLHAQTYDYGNAWYDPGADYLRFKVAEDGIYRVSAQQLVQAGFDTTGIDPANLHLRYRGVEQFIHIEPAQNGNWEYLEFFGRRNDGGLDTLLYVDAYTRLADPTIHPNPLVSTFSDTSVYYFHADNLPGLRLQTPFLGSVPPPLLIEEITKTSVVEFLPGNGATFRTDGGSHYDIFQALNSEWTTGEGYVGQSFSPSNDILLPIPTPHALNNAPARLFLRMESLQPWPQGFEISLNGVLLRVDTLNGIFANSYELAYPFPFVSDTQLLRIHIDPLTSQVSDKNFLNFAAISYNAETDLDGASTVAFPVSNPAMVYYQFHDVASGSIAVAHDLLNQVRYTDTIHGDSLGIWVVGQANPGLFYLSADLGILTPSISPGIGSNLSDAGNSANMVLITSRELDASAQAYRNYRQGSTVNPLNVKIVYTDEIYEEFGNGSPHPLAIKRFCKYAIDQWAVKPDYFLIWGKGKADIRAGGINHVPAYGEPVSDIMYISSFATWVPTTEAVIGRVPIQTDQQGFDYLDKLATYEGIADAPWMRNGVFVSGALDTTALRPINYYMDSVAADFRMGPMNGRAMTYSWLNSVLEDSSGIGQDSVINGGAILVYLFGVNYTYTGINH
ncbi:MAG TPA: C25 family cysteine peptidase, partial [Bacteroidia bacterium]|nr:C25 family cysteine peptidase [Bacteroidia bacterium]